MVWYDSAPVFGEGVTKYEGQRYDSDKTTFRTFEAARRAARKRIAVSIKELQDELDLLEKLNADTCEEVSNPFA